MKWISRLDARFGRFAVANVTLVIILGQVIAFFAANMRGVEVLARLELVAGRVWAGEVWRLFTFVFVPPSLNPLWALLEWYVLYLMGTALETFWGPFRYNVYLLIFLLASIAAGMLAPPVLLDGGLGRTGYLPVSMLVAFAYLFPNFEFVLFFILPIRVKWLALLAWIGLAWMAVSGGWGDRAMVLATVLNFFVFFGGQLAAWVRDKRRRKAFESRVRAAEGRGNPRHRCAVCGLTNLDDPKMQFRYCSQCEGQLCYCVEHLRDHEHVRREDEAAVVRGGRRD